MSARGRDVYESLQSANRFSLRDVVASPEIAQQPIPVQSSGGLFRVKEQPRPLSTPASAGVSMKLNFGANFQVKQDAEPVVAKPEHRPNLNFSFGAGGAKPLGHQRAMKLVLAGSQQAQQPPQAAPAQHAAASRGDEMEKHEIMRLTGFVEDLTARLKRAQLKLEQTDANLQYAQKTLQAERQTTTKQSEAFKKELATAHETETKLRAELSARPQRSALSQSAFSQAVGSILADEQRVEMHSREVQELECKIKALGDAKVLIEAEVEGIRKLRDQTNAELEAVRAQQSEMKASADESQRLVKLGEEALAAIEARKKLALDEIKTAETKQEAIAREHQGVLAKVVEAKGTLDELNGKLASLRIETTEAEAISATAKSAAASAAAAASEAQVTQSSAEATRSAAAETLDAVQSEVETTNAQIAPLRVQLEELEAQKLEAQTALNAARKAAAVEQQAAVAAREQLAATNVAIKEAETKKLHAETAASKVLDDVPEFLFDEEDADKPGVGTSLVAPTLMDAPIPDASKTPLSTELPCPSKKSVVGKVTGHIPTSTPGHGGTAAMRRAATIALTRIMPAAAILDAHVDLGAHTMDTGAFGLTSPTNGAPSAAAKDPQTKMVEAVIGDLKAALTSITERKVPPRRMVTAI